MSDKIKILWLYPDILNLHGDRGNLMALERIGGLLGLPLDIVRVESLDHPLMLEDADMLFICSGEVKNMPQIIAHLNQQKEELHSFLQRGGYLFAIGSAGAVLAKKTLLTDGSAFAGTALLPMQCRHRDNVYGDDIWFSLLDEPQMQIMGNQIQILDTQLDDDARPLGTIIYGHGNMGCQDEGCRKDNVIFTNTLGPLFVKNPRYTAAVLEDIAARKQLAQTRELSDSDTEYEDKSAVLIRNFIEKKMS